MDGHSRGAVLVVDDEPTIAEVVARYLERAGYTTRVARDGPQALESASSSRPDLVVLDLMLPRMDRLEVMRRLREQATTESRSSCSPPRAKSQSA
jgi:two-component system response regulator ResD